jgi:hypothetical protein
VQDIEALRNHLIAKEEGTTAAIKAISELQAKRDLTLIDRFNAAKKLGSKSLLRSRQNHLKPSRRALATKTMQWAECV